MDDDSLRVVVWGQRYQVATDEGRFLARAKPMTNAMGETSAMLEILEVLAGYPMAGSRTIRWLNWFPE